MSKNKQKTNNFIADDNEKVKLNLKDFNNNVRIEDGVLIRVKSNVVGGLTYKNTRTNETTRWEKCGEVQVLTMGDLREMKAMQSSFFVNQWIIILGVEEGYNCNASIGDIYKSLGIIKHYENLVEPSDYETICKWTEEQIFEKTANMTQEAKSNLAIAINEFIKNGTLDSVKKIKAFEEALGCELSREPEGEEE